MEHEDELGGRAIAAPAPTGSALVELSEAEAQRRMRAAGPPARQVSSRSYASIVRANLLTVFNAILAGFGP